MSTLRINNIEAKSVPASPTLDEKVKITNSTGDVLVHVDGKTSGITTIGINTTASNITFDANSNVKLTGIVTATTLAVNDASSATSGSRISVGISEDIKIYHIGGADSYIRNSTGDFFLQGNNSGTPVNNIKFENSTGATELYHNGTKQCETSANGLAFPSGKGIDFSAQSGTASGMASELLDHYEEGSFTPELSFGNTTTGQSYQAQVGRYTRVGNRCFATCYIYFTNKGSSTGTARIGGLPFTIANISQFYQTGALWVHNWNGGNTVPTGYGEINTTTFRLERQNASNSSGVFTCDHTNFNNNSDLMLSFHYQVQ